jgi:hypothetical protein
MARTIVNHAEEEMNNMATIIKFVTQQRWEYDFPLTRETELRKDLKLWGDDAVEFIIAFSAEYDVDISSFDMNKYFPSEGDAILPAIRRLLSMQKKREYTVLTLGDLEQAIDKGKLD